MLYPKMNNARCVFSLDGLWKFKLLENGETYVPGTVLEDFEWLSVPASYNDQKEIPGFRRFAGLSVYQREFTMPAMLLHQRQVIRFDAVANECTVYINEKELTHHKGGYLPFEAELTSLNLPGETFLITVVVDNRVNSSTLPVGNEKKNGAFFGSDNAQVPAVQKGKEYQADINLPNFDFFNYAGINRPVRIYTTPFEHIEDITIVTDIAENGDGIIHYDITVTGAVPFVSLGIFDENGNNVANATGSKGTIAISNPLLWAPGKENAHLYTAHISFKDDCYDQTFGIRTVEVKDKKFLINGKPFYFKGFGKHEDFHVLGRGFNLALDVKDIGLINWIGANSFRTSHYPYAEEMYDLCDREGIIIIDETTAVGVAAQRRNPYSELHIKEHHEQVLADLIARDKNHPCVVMWSLGNEPDTENHPKAALEYWSALYKMAHELDPQNRPVTMVCCQNDYTRDLTTRTMDVVCLNRYYGWYNLSGDLDAAMYALNIELDFWEEQNKPVMFTEYGADAYPGIHNTVPEMFSEEFQAELLMEFGKQFDKRDFIVGEQMWNFADFGTIQGPMRVDGNKKGLFTRERRPKLAAHAMRQRWGNMNK
ncbi:MAG: beta-glucuronidase [Pseudobutyrivibrio sp.]|nr:beta-glucuronidase [Pseudobutyrivibrio sp.]